MALVEKLKENILNNFYTIHPKGKELLDMDLQETLDHRCDSMVCSEKEVSAELRVKIVELETQVKDLESGIVVLNSAIEVYETIN